MKERQWAPLAFPFPPPPMPSKNLDQQIRSHVDTLVAELTELVREEALRTVQEALGGAASAPRRRRPGRPRKKAKRTRRKTARKRVRRSSADVGALADRILAHVKAHPGRGITEIARSLRRTSKDLRLPVLKLLAKRKLKTTGQRRGTKYHPAGRGGATTRKKAAKRKATKKKRVGKKAKRKTARRRGKKVRRRRTKG